MKTFLLRLQITAFTMRKMKATLIRTMAEYLLSGIESLAPTKKKTMQSHRSTVSEAKLIRLIQFGPTCISM